MSWWDSSNFSSLASQALKNAQKKIDKVLDIDEKDPSKKRSLAKQKANQKEDKKEEKESDGGDFWSAWMGTPNKTPDTDSDRQSPVPSSWNLPWGSKSDTPEGASKGDGDKKQIDQPVVAASKVKAAHSKLFPSEGRKARLQEFEVGEDEGTWVGDSGKGVAGSSLQEDECVMAACQDDTRGGTGAETRNVQCPDLLAVGAEEELEEPENVSSPRLNFVPEDDGDLAASTERNFSSDVPTTESVVTESVCDVQETCVISPSGGDTSDSVINVPEGNETYFHGKSDIVQEGNGNYFHEKSDSYVLEGNGSYFHEKSDSNVQEGNEKSDSNVQEGNEKSDSNVREGNERCSHEGSDLNAEKVESTDSDVFDERNLCENVSNGSTRDHGMETEARQEENLCDVSVVQGSTPGGDTEHIIANTEDNREKLLVAEKEDWKEQGVECDIVTSSSDHLELKIPTVDPLNSLDSGDFSASKPDEGGNPSGNVIPSGEYESDSQCSGTMQDYVNVSFTAKESPTLKETGEQSLSDLELRTSATSSEFETTVVEPCSSEGSSETSRLDSSADTVVDSKSVEEGTKGDCYSLFGDVKYEVDSEHKGHFQIGDTISPASSFVKCMLEDAMEESCKEDSGSDNHSSGSKSESSKLDSEFEKSIHSGQESSDDIETTTSSDIEIISASGLGDKPFQPGFDLPPLKICVQQRSAGRHGHSQHHFDSHSSSSTQSKCGDHDELSPERGEVHAWRDAELQHSDLESVQEEGRDNPYHPERLLKKLAEMAEVLQARETKLVSVSKDNHQLVEDLAILRSQLQQSEETRETETADLKALTDEFTVRIGESEKKLQNIIREKESLKQQLDVARAELERRSQNCDVELLLEEKTEQVEQLMREGEKLSKQQLQNSTIIKKLRAKEKEFDGTVTSQKKKLEDQTAELERLKTVLDSKDNMESKQAEAINQLNTAVQKQEQDYAKALSDLEDGQEKNRGLQTAVDKAYKEIAELHRSNASQDSKAQEAALSKETSLREEMKMTLEREQQRFRQEREAFIMQADDLRMDMTRLEKEHNRREDLLREEIAHLQERLQEDEARSQDVSHSITSATRPLLRQIENLQATFGAQSNAWEKVEKNLTDRLSEAQIALAIAQEKERTASEGEMELRAKAMSLESGNTRLKQDKAQLVAQKELDQVRLEELQDARNSFIAQLETSKQSLNHDLTQVKMERVQLESQLTLETNKFENEKRKTSMLEEQLRLMEKERPKSRSTPSPSPSPSMSISRQESMMGSFYERNSPGLGLSFSEDMLEGGGSDGRSSMKTSVYDNLRQSGNTVLMENLQSQLKLREGEVGHLQTEIAQLERTRESMARELVNLSNHNDQLKETVTRFEQLEQEHKELNNRYSAILLMYGEKEEQVQELRLDLQDVKEMYKSQIDALLAK